MLKKILKTSAFLLFLFFSVPAFSADGLMWGARNIRVVKTVWFDIIYAPESEESAAALVQNADNIYYEIAALYGREPQARMPVVLSAKTEEFNAYYSSQYYNCIVLYDTAVSDGVAVFSNDLLSTFRHELTHAYTYNMKNGFWSGIGRVFGDCVNPAGLTITSGWAEGATMTSEAAGGEGRLNNEFSMHMVKQAKIENKFPAYADVQGAADVYPGGSYYYFNGAFDQWLQNEYGMEKYAQFWYRCVNMKNITAGGAFKKAYGIKLKKAWIKFRDSVEVPDVKAIPLGNDFITDYFSGSAEKYSARNKGGFIYDSLAFSEKGLAWIDAKTETVWFEGRKLFTHYGTDSISLSQDGRFLALSFTDTKTPVYTKKEKVYDMEKGKFVSVNSNGLSGASVITAGSDYYLVSMGFESQKKWIDIKKLNLDEKGELKDVSDVRKILLPENTLPYSFIDLNEADGTFAFIKKEALTYSICVYSVSGNETVEYILPYDRMVIKNLSYDCSSKEFLFSWAKKGTMPRLGKLSAAAEEFVLYGNDLSGGIFNPVKNESGSVVYIGNFYRENRILVLNEEALTVEYSEPAVTEKNSYAVPAVNTEYKKILEGSKKYHSINYPRGLFVPFGNLTSTCYIDIDNGIYPDSLSHPKTSLWCGLTYMGNNPWSSGMYAIATGMEFEKGLAGLSMTFKGGSNTSLFTWNVHGQIEANYKEMYLHQSIVDGNLSFNIPLGKISRLGIGNYTDFVAVHSQGFYLQDDVFDVYFTTLRKTGPGYKELGGFTLGSSFQETWIYYGVTGKSAFAYDINPYVNIYIPKLIPVTCPLFLEYNLPLAVKTKFSLNTPKLAQIKSEICLFSVDFQKALPFMTGLYINRMYFSAGYDSLVYRLNGDSFYYDDTLSLKSAFGITPNIGITANRAFYTEFSIGVGMNLKKMRAGSNGFELLLLYSTSAF